MANKAISELPQAQNVNNQDLFVLEQSGIAKKLTAETFITEQGIIDALAEALDGHGGISSVTLSSVSGRIRTYLITFTDETTTTFQVYDGTSIDRIVKTSTAGLTDTYTVFMNDGSTTFFQVTNGSKGDTGYPTDEQVATAVNTWLDNNVTPGTGAVLDRTLTMSNAAAPADLVGDLKSDLNDVNSAIENGYKTIQVVSNGTFTSSGALTNTPLNRIRTDLIPVKTGQVITIDNGSFQHACGIWAGESASSSTIVRNDNSFLSANEEIIIGADGYIVIVFKKSTNEDITVQSFNGSIKLFNKWIGDLESDITRIDKDINGLNNGNEIATLSWTNSKRLNVDGVIVGASSAFNLSNPIQVSNEDFYQIDFHGLYGITDGSTIAIYDSNNNVLARYAADGNYTINANSLPVNAQYLYVCHYTTTGHATTDVSVIKRYSKRINDIENNVSKNQDNIAEIFGAISLDETYENILQGATTFTDNKFINDQGNTVSNPNFCLIDGFFPVKPNTSYKLYRGEPPLYSNAGHNWTFWDENKTFLSYTLSGSAVTSPANAAYLRFGVYISNTGSATHETFNPTNVVITEDAKPCFDDVFTGLASRPTFKGLKWIGIGDSITEANFRATYHYWDYIAAETGLNFVNMGVSGTGYKAEGSGDKAFYKRVPSMATDADVITIFGGVNDVVLSNADIGTETDTGTTTICGCVNTTLDAIETLYPANMPIGIISPLPCYCSDTTVNIHPYQQPNDDTCRMAQFVEQLALICKHRGIPFLDLFHQSNLRPWHQECNAKYFSCESATTGDGLHPNGHGHRLFYRQIMDFVQKIVMQ